MQAWYSSAWLVRGARAAAVILAALVLHGSGERHTAQVEPPVTVAEARLVFPAAKRLGKFDRERRAWLVHGENDLPLGLVLTTSPEADELIGYSGPSNLLVGLTLDQQIQAVRLLSSRDTPAHVEQVQQDDNFWKQFVGRSPVKGNDSVVAVSGSTLTSLAMAEGIERRLTGNIVSYRFPEPLTLAEVQQVLPQAKFLVPDKVHRSWLQVRNQSDELSGYALRTSPPADNVIGYAGPTETWAALDQAGENVIAVRLRKSYDTPEYVSRVVEDEHYLNQLAGRSVQDWAQIDFKQEGIEGVSGATQTSFAVAEGLRRRFVLELDQRRAAQTAHLPLRLRDAAMLCLVVGALALSFTRLKGNRKLRLVWQVILVLGFGLWLGDLLSLALFNGWAKSGVPWQSAPGLVALAAVALIVPWSTRHNVYCQHLCPHGAAQEWLGKFRRWQIKLPAGVTRGLNMVPLLLLGFAFVLAIVTSRADLSLLEPFDAWALKTAAAIPACIAIVGLVSSLFVPMAYCRFGCPTGALLKLVQSHGAERFRPRDAIALVLLLLGGVYAWRPEDDRVSKLPNAVPAKMATTFSGRAFGTTWKLQLRTAAPESLQEELATEVERIESRLSHWRSDSSTSQFNSSRTTLALEMPAELLSLVSFGTELSAATDGAFDLTIAPLADLWGFGPAGRQVPPAEAQLTAILPNVGWQKLELDPEEKTLRKKTPGLKLDLGSLLQGYAADKLGELLDARGVGEYLIDMGGELKARGRWTVAIENPADAAKPLKTLTLRNAALATSGVYRQAGHVIDPRTGRSVPARWQLIAVIRPTCLEADGWATALMSSSDAALELATREEIAALFLDSEQQTELSPAGKELFAAP